MMMLWLHLFGTDQEILAETDKSIYLWDGEPLIFAMRKFGRMCVVLYTFLGGYGLAKVYHSMGLSGSADKQNSAANTFFSHHNKTMPENHTGHTSLGVWGGGLLVLSQEELRVLT